MKRGFLYRCSVGMLVVLSFFLSPSTASAGESTETMDMPTLSVLNRAFTAMQTDQTEEAAVLFRQVLKTHPANRQARFGYGTLLVKLKDYPEALKILTALMAEFPDDFTVKNNVAWTLATATDPAYRDGRRAIILAQEALLKQPNNYHVWSTLSEANYVIGQYDRALRAAQEAERIGRTMNAPPHLLREYRLQMQKNMRAAQALSIIE